MALLLLAFMKIFSFVVVSDIPNSAFTTTWPLGSKYRSWVQVMARAGACLLASSRWEPALLGRPSASEARLGCKLDFVLAELCFSLELSL